MNKNAALRLAQQYGHAVNEKVQDDPGPFRHVWNWFLDLHRRRGFDGAAGVSHPLSWSDIKAWSELTATPLATHEIRLLTKMDDILISEERKAAAARAKEKTSRRR